MIRKVKIILIILLIAGGTFIVYLNSIYRVNYEHNVSLPPSAKIIEINSEWWIPKWDKTERHLSCVVEVKKTDFEFFVENGEWRKFYFNNDVLIFSSDNSIVAGEKYFSDDNQNPDRRRWIEILTSDNTKITFKLLTTCS